MSDSSVSPKLVHIPLGSEHPYDPLPVERAPRQPLAGQPITLGVAAYPAGTVRSVAVEWWVGDVAQQRRLAATPAGEWQGGSLWTAHLPAFAGGDQVRYRFTGECDGSAMTTGEYCFSTARWSAVRDLRAYGLTPEGVELTCETETPGQFVTLAIEPQDPLAVWVRLRAGQSEPANPGAQNSPLRVLADTPHRLELAGDRFRLSIEKQPFTLAFLKPGGEVLLAEAEPGALLIDADGRLLEWRQAFSSPSDEAFSGFGERFNALNQRGNSLDVRVYEQWRSQGKKTYIPIPFFLSSRPYGVFLDTRRYVSFDLAGQQPDRWSFRAELGAQPELRACLFFSPDPREIVSAFSRLTGQPALPPDWVFGLWMSGNDWNSQATVLGQLELAQRHQIPATVLVIEAWSDEVNFYIWNDAQYTPRPDGGPLHARDFHYLPGGRWPDPQGMIDRLHAEGLRLVLWQIPTLKELEPGTPEYAAPQPQRDADERVMIEKGYCVRTADGAPYRVRVPWFHGSLLLDVTRPEAVNWWMDKRAYLLDEMGVDGFKTDGGEHIWGRDLRFGDGRASDELWNEYPVLYQQAYSAFACQHRAGDAVLFSRSGFTGAQQSPCHWAGDEASTWEAFRASILAGQNAGLSGIPFWGWDLAGFSGELPSSELYLRAAAMAAFCPIMQYHSEGNTPRTSSRDRTPWNIQEQTGDDRVIPTFRAFANLRMNLFPYIASEARFCAQSGLPLMRTLPLDFPDDPECREAPLQYLFGRDLLVAPVVSPGLTQQSVYLPRGAWTDLWTGGRSITVETPIERIPVFVQAGAILPLNLDTSGAFPSPVGNALDRYRQLTFWLYPRPGESERLWQDPVSKKSYRLRMAYDPQANRLALEIPAMPYEPVVTVPGRQGIAVRIDHY